MYVQTKKNPCYRDGYLVDHVNADDIDSLIGDANTVGPPVHNRNIEHRCKHAEDNGDLMRSRDDT